MMSLSNEDEYIFGHEGMQCRPQNGKFGGCIWGCIVLKFLWVVCVVLAACTPNTPAAVELSQVFDDSPTGFSFRYPDGWTYVIPMQGMLVLGTPETLNNEQAGPTFTAQRSAPLSVFGSLDAALDQYLQRGPLREGTSWTQLGEITTSTFLGRDARVADLQGKENAASPELRARVLATAAENSLVYLFILTAPVDTWDADGPTLEAVLASVKILE
jgi:hypothetical protein